MGISTRGSGQKGVRVGSIYGSVGDGTVNRSPFYRVFGFSNHHRILNRSRMAVCYVSAGGGTGRSPSYRVIGFMNDRYGLYPGDRNKKAS